MAENQDSTGTSRPNGEAPADYVTLILDETGSMQDCKGAAIAGFNEYLATLRQIPTPVHFTFTLFNSGRLDVCHRHQLVAQVPNLTEDTYRPEASTPLYDAIGQTLAAADREAPPESKKLFVILTDGLENASREYTHEGIVRMMKDYERQGWTFVYLGADHDAWAAGGDLGIAGDNTISFCRRDTGRTFDKLGEATTAYLSSQPGQPTEGFWKDAGPVPKDKSAPDGRTMNIPTRILLIALLSAGSAGADTGFDSRYERDDNIFNPATQYQPDNPLNSANAYDPNSAFNPVNRYHPDNPLNPANQYNFDVPFAPLDGGSESGKVRR